MSFAELARHGSFRTLELACGRCIGCRLDRSRAWAVRCMHEAQMHNESCFITLTYREDSVPPGFSLRYLDFQDFMRKLRKRVGKPIRFFMCGEYGGRYSRPHFHACIFGFSFLSDRSFWKSGVGDTPLFRSATLESLWPFGFSSIGEVTFASAAYVARYVMKKVAESGAVGSAPVDKNTGEVIRRCPEFCRMSLKPGIGASWLDRYYADVFPLGKVVMNGVETRAPRYYEKRLRKLDPDGAARLDFARDAFRKLHSEDYSDRRLAVKSEVLQARTASLKRNLVED